MFANRALLLACSSFYIYGCFPSTPNICFPLSILSSCLSGWVACACWRSCSRWALSCWMTYSFSWSSLSCSCLASVSSGDSSMFISSNAWACPYPASSLKIPGKNLPGLENISGNSESAGLFTLTSSCFYSNLCSNTSVYLMNFSSIAQLFACSSIKALLSAIAL